MTTKKKPAATKPAAKVRDLKPRKNPKGGGVIIHEKRGGSVTPNALSHNHNETFVSDATD
jgi:hypothetical protein